MRKIAASYAFLRQNLKRNVVIVFNDNGVITEILEDVKNIDSIGGVEYFNGILIPGMINCHSHLEYSYVKGMIPRGGGLPEFIRSIIAIKGNDISDEQKETAAKTWDKIMYESGVTAIADHNNNDYVYNVKKESKIFYHNLIELFDIDHQTAEETFIQGMERVEESRSYGFSSSIIPHACYTMEDDLIALTGGEKISEGGVKADGIVSVHFKESLVLGGDKERERILAGISSDRDKILFVHSIYASEEDIELAKQKYGDKLAIVVCPLSNIYIENNIADINMIFSKGVRITVGTDSLSSNETLSMVQELKCLQDKFPNVPLTETLSWATINGAKTLQIDSWAGSFEVGKHPGAVLLSGVNFDNFTLTENSKTKRVL